MLFKISTCRKLQLIQSGCWFFCTLKTCRRVYIHTTETKRKADHILNHLTGLFLKIQGSWPACERLGMCCVEKSPFPLVVGPYAPELPLTLQTPPKLAHKHTPFYQHSRQPPAPSPLCLPLQTLLITDSSCVGEYNARAKAAQLASLPTWHWVDLRHVSRPPRRLLSLLPHAVCLPISSPHTCTSLPGRTHTPRNGCILRSARSIKFKLRINDLQIMYRQGTNADESRSTAACQLRTRGKFSTKFPVDSSSIFASWLSSADLQHRSIFTYCSHTHTQSHMCTRDTGSVSSMSESERLVIALLPEGLMTPQKPNRSWGSDRAEEVSVRACVCVCCRSWVGSIAPYHPPPHPRPLCHSASLQLYKIAF